MPSRRRLREIFLNPGSRDAFAREKFPAISRHYDFLIRLLSLGMDERWRSLVISKARPPLGGRGLDVATGTGDLAIRMARSGARAVGIDLCPEMLKLALRKSRGQPSRPNLSRQRAEE